jgi:low affinity Fe/Cu permease
MMLQDEDPAQPQIRRRRITHRTQQLATASRVLYRIEHYSSLAGVALAIPFAFVCLAMAAAGLGLPNLWVASFEVTASSITLIMVFTIQHTQTREQAATQRKLDELLRAIPGAAESLMMLEEAPEHIIREVEEDQRAVRSELVEDDPNGRLT